ncbi:MAG: archease [Nanoarchaeota archaeon]|nr:archease [Nanoarchaeota archaeon]
MSFEYLPHTADRKIKATGKNLAEAFGEGALAVYNSIVDIKEVKPIKEKVFKIEAESKEAILYDFIDELLFILDTEEFIGCRIKDIELIDNKFKATIVGDSYKNYEHRGDVKAMTYSEMEIKDNEIIFVVDV